MRSSRTENILWFAVVYIHIFLRILMIYPAFKHLISICLIFTFQIVFCFYQILLYPNPTPPLLPWTYFLRLCGLLDFMAQNTLRDSVFITRIWCILCGWSNYTPYTTKLFHSVRPSVCRSRITCPLCSAYSSGWIHFIFIHLIKQLHKMCRV